MKRIDLAAVRPCEVDMPVAELPARSGSTSSPGAPAALLSTLVAIRREMVQAVADTARSLALIEPSRRLSAVNLVHYLTLRRHDVRALQPQLAALGLSSLGRAEAHALATIDAVLTQLHRMTDATARLENADAPDFDSGPRALDVQTVDLLGPPTPGRSVRVMVTMSSEAADDYALVHDLVRAGMNVMRINCAHDNPAVWQRMIDHLHRAIDALGVPCRILMDLAGPKIRTGPLEPGPAVIKVRPVRDALGRVVAPARVWLTDAGAPHPPPTPAHAALPVSAEWLTGVRVGERVTTVDARDANRTLRIVDVTGHGAWAELRKTAYFVPGMTLRRHPHGQPRGERDTQIAEIPATEGGLHLHTGDVLLITKSLAPGREVTRDRAGRVLTPATVGCTMPSVLDEVRTGESIWFDDGRLGGVIESADGDPVRVRITHAPPLGAWLRADKGINLPDSRLSVPALTAKDLEDLAFIVGRADMVALSFASRGADVEELQAQMARLGGRQPAIVLKVETRRGFEHLPEMLLVAMRLPHCGVMIARGDLAVECGFERLAEVQEEMLWICEAAHVPVIWATQVLETLAKSGMASRAEITDAAMGHRAECVMLNKGPHIMLAVRTLDDILRRMEAHQAKKRSMLRALRLAHTLEPPPHVVPPGEVMIR
jgi:pyruvate kinase